MRVIKYEELPIEFRKQIEKDKEFITKCWVNKERTKYRIQVKNKPISIGKSSVFKDEALASYLVDYTTELKNGK